MKLGIVSDLHLEFRDANFFYDISDKLHESEADVIILAGDIHRQKIMRDLFLESIQKPYFFVHGNHDYYNKFAFVEDDFHEEIFDGVKIAGACLWTHFGDDPIVEIHAREEINDFRVIPNFTTFKCKEIFSQQFKKLMQSDADIIVTHFPPTYATENPLYKNSPLNPYFMNNLDDHVYDKKLWIHGHTHTRREAMVGNCRVITNQLGYPGEIKEPYEIKIVEV